MMTFTKSDLVTFAIGAAIAAVLIFGETLVKLDGQVAVDWSQWGWTLLIGELTALGRYLTTRLPELMAGLRSE